MVENTKATIPKMRLTFGKTLGAFADIALDNPTAARIMVRSEVIIATILMQGIKATIIEIIPSTKAVILIFSPAFDRCNFSSMSFLILIYYNGF